MSYVVLARKYRPRSFAEMVGQEHVVQALSNALTRQRLHHAYLFTGTRGVGKTTVSRILAKSLNCTGPDGLGGITAQPCGVCPACRDIDSGRYVDYVELDAASNRGVDEISQLLDQAVYKPVVGRFKVYLIDEVHMLSTTAFNAMLKTLEEPPEYLKFVLATTDPQKVPVTVLSRCLQFNLRPMAPETIEAHLGQVLGAEAVASEPAALRLLARAARGSMRDALSLTDQAIAFAGGQLAEAPVRQMLGAVDRGHVVRLVEALAASDGAAMVEVVSQLRGLGLSASGFLEELLALAQQLAVVQAVPAALDLADPDAPVLQQLAGLLPADEIQLLYSIALHGRAELGLAPDEYSGLTMVLLRLLAFRPAGGSAAVPPSSVSPARTGTAGSVALAASGSVARSSAATSTARAGVVAAPMPAPAPAFVPASSPVQPVAVAPATADLRSTPTPTPALAPAVLPPASAALHHAPHNQATARAQPAAPAPAPAPAARLTPQAAPAAAAYRSAASTRGVAEEPPPWLDIPPEDSNQASSSARPPWEDEAPEPAAPVRPAPERHPRPVETVAVVAAATVEPEQARPAAELTAALTTDMPAPAADPAASALMQRWLMVAEQLFARGVLAGMVRELAWQAQCVAVQAVDGGERWVLRVERESLRQPSHRDRLQAAMGDLLELRVQLDVEAGAVSDSAARRDAAAKVLAQAEAEAVILHDPLVQQLLAQYPSARVVPGSIRPR